MRISKHLQRIDSANGFALCYHSLRGNLYLLEPRYLAVLDLISQEKLEKLTCQHQSIIQELREAGYILENGDDARESLEAKNRQWIERAIDGGQLRLLNLMISEECNFGCRHCLHRCSIDVNPTHGKKKIMDFETAQRAFDAYRRIVKRTYSGSLNVHFGSAEPLLNWAVMKDIIEYIHKLEEDAEITVNTNLSLLSVEIAMFFKKHRVYISTSLDGPPEGNDIIRVFADSGGTSATILANMQLLADIGFPLDGFSITINDRNFASVTPKFVEWARENGFQGIATDIDLINTSESGYSINQYVDKLMGIRHACNKQGIENFGTWTTIYHNLVNGSDDDMPAFCKAAKGQNISVNAEGNIFICGHTTTPIGHLNDINAVFTPNSPYISLVRSRLPGNNKECFGCEIEGVCAGQCQITKEVARSTGNNRDKILCRFYRRATRKLLADKLQSELADFAGRR